MNEQQTEALLDLRGKLQSDPTWAKTIRERSGLTLDDVAAIVTSAKSTILRWETGEQKPSFPNGVEYAQLLNRLAKAQFQAKVDIQGSIGIIDTEGVNR